MRFSMAFSKFLTEYKPHRLAIALLILLALPLLAHGQEATLLGTVTDPSGESCQMSKLRLRTRRRGSTNAGDQ